jgi:enoyl-CoA hydratase/carnithine racemase
VKTDYSAVDVEVDGAVATIWLNKPERLNSWSADLSIDLVDALREVEAAEEIKGVVLTGRGRAFSAGADLKNPRTHKTDDVEEAMAHRTGGSAPFDVLSHYDKPIVCAVNGYAIGIGALVPLCCDFVYAAESAQFQLPQVALGVLPAYGGSLRLARAVGNLNAAEMILTGRMISAEEAGRWGMAAVVLPDDELIPHAQSSMKTITEHPQSAVQLARESLRTSVEANNIRAAEVSDVDRFMLLSQLKDSARQHQAWRDNR